MQQGIKWMVGELSEGLPLSRHALLSFLPIHAKKMLYRKALQILNYFIVFSGTLLLKTCLALLETWPKFYSCEYSLYLSLLLRVCEDPPVGAGEGGAGFRYCPQGGAVVGSASSSTFGNWPINDVVMWASYESRRSGIDRFWGSSPVVFSADERLLTFGDVFGSLEIVMISVLSLSTSGKTAGRYLEPLREKAQWVVVRMKDEQKQKQFHGRALDKSRRCSTAK